MNRNRNLILFLLLISCGSLLLPSCEAQAQPPPREAYLPLKIEIMFAYSLNFTLKVTTGIVGSKWRETKQNDYMAFECETSRDDFLIIFEVTYPQPVEQIMTVKFYEGKRLPVIEYIHYTTGVPDPRATNLGAPSSHLLRRYYVHTLPEPTDPAEIVRQLHQRESEERAAAEKKADERQKEVMAQLKLNNAIVAVLVSAVLVVFLLLAYRTVEHR